MLHGCVKGVSRSGGRGGYSHRQIDLIGPPVPLLEPRSHAPPERRKILHFAKTAACEAGTGPASFRSAEVRRAGGDRRRRGAYSDCGSSGGATAAGVGDVVAWV